MPSNSIINVNGDDIISGILLTLLNQFPGLSSTQRIEFATLAEASGIGFFPTSGAALLSNRKSITGHVYQMCLYPFTIIYRAAPKSEAQRMRIKEFLDLLGRWLELQSISINGSAYKLSAYPRIGMDGSQRIQQISRTAPANLNAAYQDGIEDWSLMLQLNYENEYDE